MRLRTILALIIALGLSIAAMGTEPTPMELNLEPARAEIGLFHGGVELLVSADVEPEIEVALLVTASPSDLHMQKKERVWGLFWAPTDDVVFEKIPNLYLLLTSTELDDLASKQILNELGLGYEALRHPREQDGGEDLFQELIRLKESEGLFSFSTGTADVENQTRNMVERISVAVRLPANAPAATYTVRLFGFRDGKLVSRGEGNFELRQATLIAFITSLAREHGLLYGLLAVVSALAAGLGVGFLFGSSGKH